MDYITLSELLDKRVKKILSGSELLFVYELNKYYEFNFKSLNNIINRFIDKFDAAEIKLNADDFSYTPYVKEYTNSSIFQPLKSNQYYQGKMDFWYFFACKGIDLLNSNGIEAFIAPNNWITNSGASILRNKVLNETEIKVWRHLQKLQGKIAIHCYFYVV